MSARILDGKAIAAQVRSEVAERVARLGSPPGLAAVLVDYDPASKIYVGQKRKMAAEVGIVSYDRDLPATVSQDEMLLVVGELNADPAVHGIIVQLPVPEGIDPIVIQEAIDPRKDVDALHPENQGLLALGRPRFVPATPAAVVEILRRSGIEVEGSHVVVVGRSSLVGRPLSILLSTKERGLNATVTLCHTGTKDLAGQTRRADILVVAAGRAKAISADMVRPGAVVVDVGINQGPDGKLCGDVDFDSVREVASAITPVPGGIGPMTVAMLLSNAARAAGA